MHIDEARESVDARLQTFLPQIFMPMIQSECGKRKRCKSPSQNNLSTETDLSTEMDFHRVAQRGGRLLGPSSIVSHAPGWQFVW